MIKIKNFISPRLKNLKAYDAKQVSCKIKLDIQENPYDLSRILKLRILSKIEKLSFNRYPDPSAMELRKAIASYTGADRENIVIGNGSDELILNLLVAFGGSSKRVVYPVPTFSMYEILSNCTGCSPRGIKLDKNFDLDVAKIIQAKPDIIFLSYPNNPTGNCFTTSRILEVIKHVQSIVIIDEAYYEFSQKTLLKLVKSQPNVVILRTFSKACGLAGLRVGYCIASREIIEQLMKVKLPYNVNVLSQAIAQSVLENKRFLSEKIRALTSQRDKMYNSLAKISGINPYPTEANFILFKSGKPADEVYEALLKQEILIKNMSQEVMLKDCLRVTVGTPLENSMFLESLNIIMGG